MKIAPLPANEAGRLKALRRYEILDTAPEQSFDRMTELAAFICNTPIAVISLVAENRQWFKAKTGISASETSRDVSFCAHAILHEAPFIVPDATQDERFFDNPLVTSYPDIRFYAGIPLVTGDGFALGTLCAIDRIPRELSDEQLQALTKLADQVKALLELRLANREIREYIDELQVAELIYKNSSEAMMVADENQNILDVNPAFTRLTGYTLQEVQGRNPRILSSGRQGKPFYHALWQALESNGRWQGEIWNRRKDGEVYAEWLSINTILNDDGTVHRYVAIFSDITEKKQFDALMWRQANHDHLTDLPNRRLFHYRLEAELKKSRRARLTLALLFIDLDGFKEVNDTLGHDMGDALLVEAARRIASCVRESDMVARLGGDEFTVIISDLNDPTKVERVTRAIIAAVGSPFPLGNVEVQVSASIGVAIGPMDGDNADELIRAADRAMYCAKSEGRNRFCYFREDAPEAARQA